MGVKRGNPDRVEPTRVDPNLRAVKINCGRRRLLIVSWPKPAKSMSGWGNAVLITFFQVCVTYWPEKANIYFWTPVRNCCLMNRSAEVWNRLCLLIDFEWESTLCKV